MKGGFVRILILGAAMWIVACGGRQSSVPTTVTSGGAKVPAQPHHGTSEASNPETTADEPIDLDAFAREPDHDDQPLDRDITDDTEKRDVKMMSYEKAMERPIEIGDAMSDGGETQLSASEVARFMDAHLDEMYDECIRTELERGNELGTVTIDLAIRGRDGMVLGTTIEPGRRRFKNCLKNYLEDVRFPTFASPRMGARYRFHTS